MRIIPEIALTDFRKFKAPELRQLKSCHVTSDGNYLFTFINPKSDYIKMSVENMAQLSNAVGGKDPDVLLGKETVNA